MVDSDTANSLPMNEKDLGWTALPDLEGVYDPRGVAIGDHRFAVGQDRCYASLYVSTRTYHRRWVDLPLADLPLDGFSRVSRSGVAVVGDRLYVIGGKSEVGTRLSRVDSHRIQDNNFFRNERTSWQERAPMNHARSAFACASDDRFVYVFGGGTEQDECSASAEVYDTQTDQWKSLPNMPGGGRAHCAAVRIGHRIFVVGAMSHHRSQGGESLYRFLASTVVYNVLQQEWEPAKTCGNNHALGKSVHSKMVPEMSVPRAYHALVAVDRFVIALGGLFPGAVSSVEVLDTRDNVWDIGPTQMADYMRYTFCAGRLKNNVILAVGGYKDDKTKSWVGTLPFSGILPNSFRNTDIFRFVKKHFCNSSLLYDAKKRKKLNVFGARDADASVAKKPRIK